MDLSEPQDIIDYEKDMNRIELCNHPLVLVDCDIMVYIACSICETKTTFIDRDGTTKDSLFLLNESAGYHYIDETLKKISDDLDASKVACFLSTTDKDKNYRTHVKGADKVYKGNRKKEKPYYYQHMRSYFINVYKSLVCEVDEADDHIGKLLYADYQKAFNYISQFGVTDEGEENYDLKISCCKCSVVVASTDKDFDQFAGYIWNFQHCELSYSDHFGYISLKETIAKSGIKTYLVKGRGFLYFCAQMLTGDAADNITGIHRCGPKTAYKTLKDCVDNRGAWKAVVDLYRDKGVSDKQLLAHATLLWITHEEGRLLPHSHLIEEMV